MPLKNCSLANIFLNTEKTLQILSQLNRNIAKITQRSSD